MSYGLIAGIVILALIVAIALSQRSHPRVTHIETHREREDDLEGRHD
ncbi:hypothetical protein H9L13_08790 [Sphingomonas lutea]|uniref:Uncharacterized protein n=1 Tax=Sphingomonas lutea TaxID=1045317 RepID=A0A7G9SFZ4_9SPHN|nr:hypothetical protein [Sphingomonas lutea]QNN66769.1 hypothetical protein H9L13_08790 [Sphingomonas lutea]